MIQFRSNKDKDSFNGMKAISKSLSRSRDERTDVSLVMSPYLKGPPNEIASKQELKSISRDLIMTTRESRPNTQYPELIPEYNSIKDCNVPKAQAELFTDLKDFILINHEKEEHNYADPIPIIHSVPIVSTTNKNNHGKAVTKASSNGREDVGKVQGTKVVLSASVVTIADLNDSGGKTTKETDRQNYLNEKSIAETSKDSVSFARPINKGLKLKTNTEASKESSQKMLEELKARRENRKQLRAEEQ